MLKVIVPRTNFIEDKLLFIAWNKNVLSSCNQNRKHILNVYSSHYWLRCNFQHFCHQSVAIGFYWKMVFMVLFWSPSNQKRVFQHTRPSSRSQSCFSSVINHNHCLQRPSLLVCDQREDLWCFHRYLSLSVRPFAGLSMLSIGLNH